LARGLLSAPARHASWIDPVSPFDKPLAPPRNTLSAPSGGESAGARKTAGADPAQTSPTFDLVGILSAIEETAYNWDVLSDRIEWERNALDVLGVTSAADIETGTQFQLLIAPEHLGRRQQVQAAATSAESIGTMPAPFRVQYKFLPYGLRSDLSIWLEDHGHVWTGPDGRPVRIRGVIRVVNDRYWEEQRLLHRSDHDELTGQLNRIRLTEALGAVLGRAQRASRPCAFLMAAVNNLSLINETFGYDSGDEVIAATARIIRSRLRGGDSLGRYSSNKFGIILNDCGTGAMRIAAERFMKAVRDTTIKTPACQISATVSIGGVVIPDQAANIHDALSHALHALDRAKQKRFDCFMAYEPSPTRETARQRNINIADEVISALDENRMRLVLQPMVDSRTGKATLYECLLRMEKRDGSTVSAGEFITVAEQLGLSRLIDKRTLELAILLLRKHFNLRLSLNVSSLTASDHDWVVALHRLTGGRKEITGRLTIEITETTAIHDLDQTVAFVDTLRELGCRVAIDDFGAGYTSFKNLKALSVDMVKIDGTFVKDLSKDPSGEVFIKSMVEIARTFGMETVAEWVGDQETADFLTNAGITYLQGFHYGQPLSVEDYEALQQRPV
jgi:diguanylate cyclase (GGDEF)-like protein